jgi:transposase-like protein
MDDESQIICVYCKSRKIIKHGTTAVGSKRYRCRTCNRTWIDSKEAVQRPEIWQISKDYLEGSSCRELVDVYHSSPLRINQKIREYLSGAPLWEDYLDTVVDKHDVRLIYLIGKKFSTSYDGNKDNSMFLALAVDMMSSVVLGYEVGPEDSMETWMYLLDRLNCRGIISPVFMYNGSQQIEPAVKTVFPFSNVRVFFHRAYRDNELKCCLSRVNFSDKLLYDSIKSYDGLKNNNLSNFLKKNYEFSFSDILLNSKDNLFKRLKERLENPNKIRAEGIINTFQDRFEKFHMIKEDPHPIINGWIANKMLEPQQFGYSRLALYMRLPITVGFHDFGCGNKPKINKIRKNDSFLRQFILEVAIRSLQMPVFFSKCEMQIDKCAIFDYAS